MATISHKRIIDDLIARDGRSDDGDPDVACIVEYTNYYGGTCWGVTWVSESTDRQQRYLESSEYVINPRIIWPTTERA